MGSLAAYLRSPEFVDRSLAERGLPADGSRYTRQLERLGAELGAAPERPVWLASAPGRTELAGNHTDHNRGRVLAAAVTLDTIAAVAPRKDSRVRVASEGFPLLDIDLADPAPRPAERETTAALLRGVGAGLVGRGFRIGGFDAAVSSTVLVGSGLSSSASVEMLFAAVLSGLHNGGEIPAVTLAQAGQFAENEYFGKPSGLMDQVACAVGGAVAIDFADPANPVIDSVDVDFAAAGLALLVVDTGANHADLTGEYAAIPREMRTVAGLLGAEVLRDVDQKAFYASLPRIRGEAGDRAAARAIHFYEENPRVELMVAALRKADMGAYLALMAESGHSSALLLQNCAPVGDPGEQGVVVALGLTGRFFSAAGLRNGRTAACRVHGGGFAGTIQVVLPADLADDYTAFLEPLLGPASVTRLGIRNTGATAFSI